MTTQTVSQQVPAGTYEVDPVHSTIHFAVVHNGVSTFRSGFRDYEAKLEGGESAAARGHGRGRQRRHRRGDAEGPPALPRVLRRRALPAAEVPLDRVRGRRGRRPEAARRAGDPRHHPRGRGQRQVRPARDRPRRQRPRRLLARRPASTAAASGSTGRRSCPAAARSSTTRSTSPSSSSSSRRPSSHAGPGHIRQPAPGLAQQRPAAGGRRAAARRGGAGRVRGPARDPALRRGPRSWRRRRRRCGSCARRCARPTRS